MRIMKEGIKIERILSNEDVTASENETTKILEALSKKIALLENLGFTYNAIEENCCIHKNECYTTNYKMGECPCELYRI
jgi:hypothetical protein